MPGEQRGRPGDLRGESGKLPFLPPSLLTQPSGGAYTCPDTSEVARETGVTSPGSLPTIPTQSRGGAERCRETSEVVPGSSVVRPGCTWSRYRRHAIIG